MKKFFIFLFFLISIMLLNNNLYSEDFIKYVDPFIGTNTEGHTFPGPVHPFGMVSPSPDTGTTGWEHCSGYHYSDNHILGFSNVHLSGTGCGEFGNLLFVPLNDNIEKYNLVKNDIKSLFNYSFTHDNEAAHPGYYSVILNNDSHKDIIKVELTASERAILHKYTFLQRNIEKNILIDLTNRIRGYSDGGEIKIVSNNTVEGFISYSRNTGGWCASGAAYNIYYSINFSENFDNFAIWTDEGLFKEKRHVKYIKSFPALNRTPDATSAEVESMIRGNKPKLGAYFNFKNNKDKNVIYAKIGLSFVSIEGARKNKRDIDGFDFEKTKKKTEVKWNELQKEPFTLPSIIL